MKAITIRALSGNLMVLFTIGSLLLSACSTAAPATLAAPTPTPLPAGALLPATGPTPTPVSVLVPALPTLAINPPVAITSTAAAPVLNLPSPTLAGANPVNPQAVTPAVLATDQKISHGAIYIAQITSAGPGWMTIHADALGKPGAVIGIAPVVAGTNSNVRVNVDETRATPIVYAMLHVDAGIPGTFEFPGADSPVMVNGQMVSPLIRMLGDVPDDKVTPSVTTVNQAVVNGMVNVPQVLSKKPGWVVIHASIGGNPGQVLGYAAVRPGMNLNVPVKINQPNPSGELFAVLYEDDGRLGVFENPGPDQPETEDDLPISEPFQVLPPTSSSGSSGPTLPNPPAAPAVAATALPAQPSPTMAAAPTATQSPPPSAPMTATVVLQNGFFLPQVLTISPGTTVTWVDNDIEPHTVTARDGSFDSGTLGQGQTFSYTFTKPGVYGYICKFHAAMGMVGTITVR